MQGLTKGSHGLVLDGRLAVAGGQVRARVVAALVVVVLDVEAGQLGVADPQRAAGVIDVLSVQGLHRRERDRETFTEKAAFRLYSKEMHRFTRLIRLYTCRSRQKKHFITNTTPKG